MIITSDFLCLPPEPSLFNYTSGIDIDRAHIHSSEPEVHVFPYPIQNQDLPCTVCRSLKSTVLMIAGRADCYPYLGWNTVAISWPRYAIELGLKAVSALILSLSLYLTVEAMKTNIHYILLKQYVVHSLALPACRNVSLHVSCVTCNSWICEWNEIHACMICEEYLQLNIR